MPTTLAIDLADHDVIADDNELMVGPHSAKFTGAGSHISGGVSTGAPPVAAATAPAAQRLARPPSAGLYAVIATASAPRTSEATQRQPQISPSSGGPAPNPQLTTAASFARDTVDGRAAEGVTARIQGDILGGDSDSAAPNPMKKALSLRRQSSASDAAVTQFLGAGARPPTPKPSQQPRTEPAGASGSASGVSEPSAGSSRRASSGTGAMPGVDAEPDRLRPQLVRRNSMKGHQDPVPAAATVLTVLPKGATNRPPTPTGPTAASDSATLPASSTGAAAAAAAAAFTTNGSFRSRASLMTDVQPSSGSFGGVGATVVPVSHNGPPDSPSGSSGRPSSRGRLRSLFTRQTSQRKSEAGLLDQWERPSGGAGRQRQSNYGHSGHGTIDEEDATASGGGVGGGRQPSGLLKRTASALMSFVRRSEEGSQPALTVA